MGRAREAADLTVFRRLWHQLTGTLFQYLDISSAKNTQVDVFEKFVRPIGPKLNQLRLAELAVRVSQQLSGTHLHAAL